MSEIERIRGGIGGVTWGSLEGSVFDVDRWDSADFEFLLSTYPRIRDKAVRARESGVDAREVYFALAGKSVTGKGPVAESWQAVLRSPAWRAAVSGAKERLDRAAALNSMLDSLLRKDDDARRESGEEDGDDREGVVALDGVPGEGDAEKAGQAAAVVRVLVGGGIGGEGKSPQETLDDALLIASRLDIGAFHKLLGFCCRVVRGASRRTRPGRDEMTGYGFSGWSESVVPQDQLAVARGDLDALARLAEGTLTRRKYSGYRAMGKGPVILLRDETGSMEWDVAGGFERTMGKHKQALALEVVLAQAFNKDKRDLVTVAWGMDELREHTWGDPACDLKDHLLSFLRAGDTRIFCGLRRGLELAGEYVDGADILIVTDGGLSDTRRVRGDEALQEELAAYRERGGRIWVVIIGKGTRPEGWRKALPFADAIVSLSDLADGSADLEKVIAGMADRSRSGGKRVLA